MGVSSCPLNLGTWHRAAEVKRLARVAVARRSGIEKKIDREALLIDMPPMEVSGTEIRARVMAGESIDGLIPAAVAGYIAEHGLYRAPH